LPNPPFALPTKRAIISLARYLRAWGMQPQEGKKHSMTRRKGTRNQGSNQLAFVISLAFLFLIVSAGIGYILFHQVKDLVAGSTLLPSVFTGGEGGEAGALPEVSLRPWEGKERVNMLVLGIDERESEEGPWRTDTMIVLTIDPLTKSGGMLSIPRDLWVPIPGYGEGRINTAHYLGDLYDYPGGGPALAMRTVEYNLGVPIHHYVRLNFRAFVELVDQIGGIDIYVPEEINDPTYPDAHYGYDPLHIPAGWVHMDGELALKYARTRHSPGGDFDRARRQQQVLRAILEKVTRLDLLPELARQAPQLWTTLSDSVQTDLQLDEIVSLAYLATQIPEENIRAAVITEECTMFWTTPDGQQVLVPIRDCVRQVRDSIFTNPAPGASGEDLAAQLTQEAATVEVQNGTGTVGLAHSTGEFLRTRGINVVNETNADRFDYAESRIYVYTGKELTAQTIAQLLNLPPTAVVTVPNSQAGVDIVVVLGADYQTPTPAPTP